MVRPSCPALLIHDDDDFRKRLIATLDQQNFSVTFTADGAEAIGYLKDRRFQVVLLGVNLATKRGVEALDFLRDERQAVKCGLILLDRKSTRLNTSHLVISYAVFCLKKKKNKVV